ncbi:hypothetical protein MN608_03285 [Microdochium nivale]|nr:hypothetical protein MN608_03285 [Microdochium nivale]
MFDYWRPMSMLHHSHLLPQRGDLLEAVAAQRGTFASSRNFMYDLLWSSELGKGSDSLDKPTRNTACFGRLCQGPRHPMKSGPDAEATMRLALAFAADDAAMLW